MEQILLDPRKQPATEPPPGPTKKRAAWPRILMAIIIALLVIGVWRLWPLAPQQQPRRPSADVMPAVTVRTGPVTQGNMPVYLNALGTVTSLATTTIKTQIVGKITEIAFKEGEYVKVGEFIIQIDPSPYQTALNQAEGQLARDQAQLEASKVDLTRYEGLMKQDSIARQQVDTQRALVRQNEGTVRADQAAVAMAKINLDYCRIVSPINGRVGLRLIDIGNYVQPSDSGGLVAITQTKPISVLFSLAQDTIPQFMPKLRSGEKLTVEVYSRDGTQKLATGQLETADNQIDTTTGTVKLRAMFANENEELFPNQFVTVKLIVDTLRDTTLAPSAAVRLGAPGSYVYVAKPDDTVTVRPVQVGPGNDMQVSIQDGLTPGEQVVIDGADRLREGASIRITGENGDAKTGEAGDNQPRRSKQTK